MVLIASRFRTGSVDDSLDSPPHSPPPPPPDEPEAEYPNFPPVYKPERTPHSNRHDPAVLSSNQTESETSRSVADPVVHTSRVDDVFHSNKADPVTHSNPPEPAARVRKSDPIASDNGVEANVTSTRAEVTHAAVKTAEAVAQNKKPEFASRVNKPGTVGSKVSCNYFMNE